MVSERGSCLSQKQEPKLSQIVPSIDLQSQRLILRARGKRWKIFLEKSLGGSKRTFKGGGGGERI